MSAPNLKQMDVREDGLTMLRLKPDVIESLGYALDRVFVELNRDRSLAEARGIVFGEGEIDVFSLKDLATIEEERLAAKNEKCAASLALVLGSLTQAFGTAIFGVEAEVLAGATYCRKQAPGRSDHHLPYHQDARVVGHAGRSITAWCPLSSGTGVTAPGLSVVPFAPGRLLPINNDFYSGIVDAELQPVIEAHGEVSPPMELGDIILFRDDVIHRTDATPDMTSPRLSIEYRILNTQSEPWPEQAEQARRKGVSVGRL